MWLWAVLGDIVIPSQAVVANALVLYSVTLYGFSGILAFLKISNFEIAITFDLSVVESPDSA